jgi:CcmD family protein
MAPQLFLITLWQTADVANRFNDYLVLGYFAMWVVAVVYIVSLAVRQRNLKQDLQLMQQILQEDEK